MLSIDAWLDEKPYREVYDGAIHEKVSPQYDHGLVAGRMYRILDDWGARRGGTIPELRVYLEPGTTLVPDVAFIAKERLALLSAEERQKPPFAPDIVVEIRSPDDRQFTISRKTELYLAHGATIVLNVDPSTRTVRMSSRDGEGVFSSHDVIDHAAFPELRIMLTEVFEVLDNQLGS